MIQTHSTLHIVIWLQFTVLAKTIRIFLLNIQVVPRIKYRNYPFILNLIVFFY